MKIKNNPRVAQFWDEGDDGLWILLKTGWRCADSESHAIHEYTLNALKAALAESVRCTCKDCEKEAAPARMKIVSR